MDKDTPFEKCRICQDWTRHTTKDGRPCCTTCYMKPLPKENTMDANEYQKLALRTEKTPRLLMNHIRWFVNGQRVGHEGDPMPGDVREVDMDKLLHGLMGMCTETGEAMDNAKKHLMYGKAFDPINVLEEAGDKLWYIAIALHACGFTMQECMERNIEKLRKRFPEGFSEEKALNRNLDAEREALEVNP